MLTIDSTCASHEKTQAYALAPDVVLLAIEDGSARLLDLGGNFYTVAAIGAEMLRVTLEHGAPAAVRHIAARYSADVGRVKNDLDAFLNDLVQRGLLITGRRRRPRALLASVVLGSALRCLHRVPGKSRATMLLLLAWLSFRLFGWVKTVRVWQAHQHSARSPVTEAEWEAQVKAVDDAVRRAAASHLITMECKERAICCWSLARAAGLPATLVIGVQLCPLAGHCWCESGQWALSDSRDRCDQYQPVIKYGGRPR
jgi:hypothetical protein